MRCLFIGENEGAPFTNYLRGNHKGEELSFVLKVFYYFVVKQCVDASLERKIFCAF